MPSKVRQVTDSIHGTIHISDLEYQMMSTPFFYRLHDVYQSSTVYMTFPSNRTKRYELSLGTMELAGRMFYSAVTNASIPDRRRFLLDLQSQFLSTLQLLEARTQLLSVGLYQSVSDKLGKLIPKTSCKPDSFFSLLKDTSTLSPLADSALRKQDICFFDILDPNDPDPIKTSSFYAFLYQCSLEALRISALFHDIGHPPFSHIIESTLQKLYTSDSSRFDANKYREFAECMEKFKECNAVEPLLLDQVNNHSSVKDPALHEQIGLHILYNAFRGLLNRNVAEWGKSPRDKGNRLRALYLVTVIEFTFGILLEKAPLFSSLHRMIDGPVDVDRLDYNVRDSRNAGVDWGTIPYNRLISTVKFTYHDDKLKIAFPEKVCEDIDDLLVNRYKIFQRINYHHKSVKTSELLQQTVEILAEDYLLSSESQEITPEIRLLWTSLGAAFGQDEVENQISQWTDSWLVSVLNSALIRLSDPDKASSLINTDINRTEESLEKLLRMLEEVQLNRKHYFPLLKRQRDALSLKDKIIEIAGISEDALHKLSSHEYNKLLSTHDGDDDKRASALEALYRIQLLQNQILDVANFGLLDVFFPGDRTCKELIEGILQQSQANGEILDYFLWENAGFRKLGISNETDISLYRREHEVYKYDVSTTLLRKINAQKAGCLWLFAYVCVPQLPEKRIESLLDSLFERIASAIGNHIHQQLNELFTFDSIIGTNTNS